MSFVRSKNTFTESFSAQTFSCVSGVPSFEKVVLGLEYIPMGSVLTLHQDFPKSLSNYSNSLIKCFVSSFLHHNRHVYLINSSNSSNTAKFLQNIPKQAKEEPIKPYSRPNIEDKLKIAHRYKHLQLEEDFALTTRIYYDLSAAVESSFLSEKETLIHYECKEDSLVPDSLIVLMDAFAPDSTLSYSQLLCYKALAKLNRSLLLISCPAYCMDARLIEQVNFISDGVVELQSISSALPEFKDFDGFVRLVKPFITQLKTNLPPNLSITFKCKSTRNFVFEPFHLPPELSEAPSRQTCSKNFDF